MGESEGGKGEKKRAGGKIIGGRYTYTHITVPSQRKRRTRRRRRRTRLFCTKGTEPGKCFWRFVIVHSSYRSCSKTSESRRDILLASKHVREAEIMQCDATRLHVSLSLSLSLLPESSEAADGARQRLGAGPPP